MIEFYYCVPFLLKIASTDFFCLVSGDGGPRKNSEAVQDHNVSGNQSSPVISMFKGDYLHFDIISHPHQCKEICLQLTFYVLSLQFSNRSLIPNMTNMSVLLRSAETSPSRARGLFFFYTEWPGKYYCIKTTQSELLEIIFA